MFDNLFDAVAGMDARQRKSPARVIETEKAAIGHERNWTAWSIDVVDAAARRTDETDLWNERAARMLGTEQDQLRHDVVEVGGAERAGKTHLGVIVVAD